MGQKTRSLGSDGSIQRPCSQESHFLRPTDRAGRTRRAQGARIWQNAQTALPNPSTRRVQ